MGLEQGWDPLEQRHLPCSSGEGPKDGGNLEELGCRQTQRHLCAGLVCGPKGKKELPGDRAAEWG